MIGRSQHIIFKNMSSKISLRKQPNRVPVPKNEALRLERDNFAFGIIGVTMGYIGITYWLNEIRATTSLWFLWTLIIIQFSLYLEIFIKSGRRYEACGLNKNISYIAFIFLAILGKINGLERLCLIIPAREQGLPVRIQDLCNNVAFRHTEHRHPIKYLQSEKQ